jgi:hypothetical protein
LTILDFDAYLTTDSVTWCQNCYLLVGRSNNTPPVASEFIYLGQELFPTWYRDLLYRARAYEASGCQPELALAPKPYLDEDDLVRTQLLQELGYEPPLR